MFFFNTNLSSHFFSWSIISISSVHHFYNAKDLQRVMELIYHHFARFGLEMHMRHVRVGDRMCFLSPSTILPTPGADKHCGLHHSTCIPPHAPRTLRTDSNGRTPPQDQQAPSPTTVTNLAFPTSFPIGCRVAVTPSHPKHANTNGTVTRHTAKFVEFTPDNCPPNTIRILPKSLMVIPPCDHSLVIFGKILRSAT